MLEQTQWHMGCDKDWIKVGFKCHANCIVKGSGGLVIIYCYEHFMKLYKQIMGTGRVRKNWENIQTPNS